MKKPNTLATLEKRIKIRFKNKEILKQALVHRSYLNEHPSFNLKSNERLEFLGDAILEFVSSLLLFKKLPEYPEGDLTNIRSMLVRTTTLAEIAQELDLGSFLYLSKGEEDLNGRKNPSLLANSFEALTGALFLDQGLPTVKKFLLNFLKPRLEKIVKSKKFKDYKSLFQEIIQAKFKKTPHYEIIKEEGPDHNKTFTVGLWAGDKLWAKGTGKSKQNAEEKAAQTALEKIKQQD